MSLSEDVLREAKTYIGKKAGQRGECFDLADVSLQAAGAKTASDYKPVHENDDYIWGTEIQLNEIVGGDILQMRGYLMERTVDKEISINFPDGDGIDYYDDHVDKVEHKNNHTAVTSSAATMGKLTVLDQNIDRGTGHKERIVRERDFYVRSVPAKTQNGTQSVTINKQWGDEVKKGYDAMADKAEAAKLKKVVDEIVKKYNGQVFTANTKTTVTIDVSGSLWAYRAEKK